MLDFQNLTRLGGKRECPCSCVAGRVLCCEGLSILRKLDIFAYRREAFESLLATRGNMNVDRQREAVRTHLAPPIGDTQMKNCRQFYIDGKWVEVGPKSGYWCGSCMLDGNFLKQTLEVIGNVMETPELLK